MRIIRNIYICKGSKVLPNVLVHVKKIILVVLILSQECFRQLACTSVLMQARGKPLCLQLLQWFFFCHTLQMPKFKFPVMICTHTYHLLRNSILARNESTPRGVTCFYLMVTSVCFWWKLKRPYSLIIIISSLSPPFFPKEAEIL